ncbi:hypothetical protein BJY01DRAFT_236876 [Aspergillus pseudoustus]|uniref:Uncharacterized protein n=1 Tax=Aspergillus pseudoustus TaxID=1810923 RepID=A0ABR4JJ52_9EURO
MPPTPSSHGSTTTGQRLRPRRRYGRLPRPTLACTPSLPPDADITYDDVEAGVACYAHAITSHAPANDPWAYNCVLVVGFEQMNRGPLVATATDRPTPSDLSVWLMAATSGQDKTPKKLQMFGNPGRKYMEKATIVVVVCEQFLKTRPELKDAILITGQSPAPNGPVLYSRTVICLVSYKITKTATAKALAGARAIIKYICKPGKAHYLIHVGDVTYRGKSPIVNPSSGLISKGHPLGATGLAQCTELTTAQASRLGYDPAVEARYITRERE